VGLEVSEEQLFYLRQHHLMISNSHPDSLHDPVTGVIVGKTFRTTRRDLGLPTRRKLKPSPRKSRPHEPVPGLGEVKRPG